MVRRFVHFEVICIAKYRYGEKYLHRKIKFYLRTGNPPSVYKQLSSNSSRTGENSLAEDTYLFTSGLLQGIFRLKNKF
jgi:hypothetical protein